MLVQAHNKLIPDDDDDDDDDDDNDVYDDRPTESDVMHDIVLLYDIFIYTYMIFRLKYFGDKNSKIVFKRSDCRN